MIKRFFNFLYGDIPVRFPSDFPMSESVLRLRERTKRSVFSSLFRQAAVGPVTESRVRLQRYVPWFGNSFKPIFVGRFCYNQGRVVLEGRFTMFLFSKVFASIWLAFALLWTILAAFAVLKGAGRTPTGSQQDLVALLIPLGGVLFFLAGIGFIRGCWWLSRNDIPFLESVIRGALHREASSSAIERRR